MAGAAKSDDRVFYTKKANQPQFEPVPIELIRQNKMIGIQLHIKQPSYQGEFIIVSN